MPWIDLSEAKLQLDKTSDADNAELAGFIDAACSVIEDLKGHVDPAEFVEVKDAARVRVPRRYGPQWLYVVDLPETPVLSVASVSLLDWQGGSTVVSPSDPDAGTPGWTLTDSVLTLTQGGTYEVSYTAGRDPVPANYRLAALELVSHLWRGSQLNSGSGRPPVRSDIQQAGRGGALVSALPYRVRELLGIYGPVVNDHVVIA